MTAFDFVQNKGASGSGTAPSVTLDNPPGESNLLVAVLYSSGTFADITNPSGFTTVDSSTGATSKMVYKVARPSDQTVAFSLANSATWNMEVLEFDGGAGVTLDNHGSGFNTAANSVGLTFAPILPVYADLLVVAAAMNADTTARFVAGGGMTLVDAAALPRLVVGYTLAVPAAGASPSIGWTGNVNSGMTAGLFANRHGGVPPDTSRVAVGAGMSRSDG